MTEPQNDRLGQYLSRLLLTSRLLKSSSRLAQWIGTAAFTSGIGLVAFGVKLLPSELGITLIVIGGMTVLFGGVLILTEWREAWLASSFSIFDEAISHRRPYPAAAQMAHESGDPERVAVGGIIELFRYPQKKSFGLNAGAKPAEVSLNLLGDFSYLAILEQDRQVADHDPDNQPKYCLVGFRPPLQDRSRVQFNLRKTYWNDYIPYVRKAKQDEEFRKRLAALDPASAKLPSSFCLHCIVSFNDGAVLLMKRNEHLEFESSKISASFEEQLADYDISLGAANDADKWFRRAFCEEIMPLSHSYKEDPELSWNMVDNYVLDRRIWALAHEVEIAGYAIIGSIVLGLPSGQFKDLYLKVGNYSRDVRDPEGSFYLIPRDEVRRLINDGSCTVQSLTGQAYPLLAEQLHFSSLYRLIVYNNVA